MGKKIAGTSNAAGVARSTAPAQEAPSSSYQGTARTTPIAPKAVAPAPASTPARAVALPRLSHEQIAIRAKAIWEKKGRPSGQDEKNWLQAEAELRTELRA